MLTVTIKDLQLRLSNSNLLIRKRAICFKLLAPKREADKQTANTL